jgi:hypothetical protein
MIPSDAAISSNAMVVEILAERFIIPSMHSPGPYSDLSAFMRHKLRD